MKNWINEAVFYQIYPLGFCGAPRYHESVESHRILKIKDWIAHIQQIGCNALYLGPLFESSEHGYDTSDYRVIDQRLGTIEDMKHVSNALHDANIRIIFDGVFNHVGRSFWAFKDVQDRRESSPYCDWFEGLHFGQDNPMHDGFTYDTWHGYHNLVKLNLKNEEVIKYLLESVGMWMDEFHIDGLRLDAADCVDVAFFRRLKQYCKQKQPDFWLMGEIIHGMYTTWANDEMLDSVTNYECYKGLYSSHNDKNYFEIAHSLNRQFAKGGIYEHLTLYNFVDNHDVNRIASTVSNKADLLNIYTLLYTIPGIPSIYYGSEWGIKGIKHDGSDADIRPTMNLCDIEENELMNHIAQLGRICHMYPLLANGKYESIVIKNEQFVFERSDDFNKLYVVLNVADEPQRVSFSIDAQACKDILHNHVCTIENGEVTIDVKAKSACIIVSDTTTIDSSSCFQEPENKDIDTITYEDIVEKDVKLQQTEIGEELKIGRYEHFKGNHYTLLYFATHSETLEKYVVYRQLYGDESIWVRPYAMFKEQVEVEDKRIPRFRYLGK